MAKRIARKETKVSKARPPKTLAAESDKPVMNKPLDTAANVEIKIDKLPKYELIQLAREYDRSNQAWGLGWESKSACVSFLWNTIADGLGVKETPEIHARIFREIARVYPFLIGE